jgi:predicted ATPase with chaperone activity
MRGPVRYRWRITAYCFSMSCRSFPELCSFLTWLSLLREAADAMRLSARGYHRVLRVARTLADEIRRAA